MDVRTENEFRGSEWLLDVCKRFCVWSLFSINIKTVFAPRGIFEEPAGKYNARVYINPYCVKTPATTDISFRSYNAFVV